MSIKQAMNKQRRLSFLWQTLVVILNLTAITARPLHAQPGNTSVAAPRPELVLQTVPSAQVTTVAFAPDGRTIASGEWDGTIKLRDAATGDLKRILSGQGENVRLLAFSPDSKLLAGGADRVNQIKLWDTVTGELKRTLTIAARDGASLIANSIVFSPDGTILAISAANDDQVWLWEAQTGKLKHLLNGAAEQLIFTPDGQTLFGLKYGSATKRWEVKTGRAQAPLKVAGNIGAALAFSPDGSAFAIQEITGTVNLYDTLTGNFKRKFASPAGESPDFKNPLVFTFSADGQTILTLDANQVLRSWNVQTGAMKETPAREKEAEEELRAICFSPDAKFFLTISGGPVIRFRLRETATGQTKWVTPPWSGMESSLKREIAERLKQSAQGVYESTAIAPNAGLVVSYKGDGVMRCLDPYTGKLKFTLARAGERLTHASFAQDGKLIVTGSDNGKWRFWDAETGSLKGTLNKVFEKLPQGFDAKAEQFLSSLSLLYSPDGRIAASFNEDAIKFWDTQEGKVRFIFKTPLHPARRASDEAGFTFAPDNQTLAVWNKQPLPGDFKTVPDSERLRVMLIDTNTGKLKHTLVTDAKWIRSLAFSPDNRTLAIFENDGLQLCEVETGRLSHRITWQGHLSTLSLGVIAFAPDGRTVAFGVETFASGVEVINRDDKGDFKVLLCDVATGQIKHRLPIADHPVFSIAFSPDGKSLAAGTFKAARWWDAQTGALKQTITNNAETSTEVVFFAPDSRRLMVSTSDRVKVYDAASGRLLVTLETLPATKPNEVNSGWIAYTPEGYYSGSENAARFIRWRVGDKLLPAESYAQQFNRPDLVQRAIQAEK